jgi:hypothetical protein
MPSKISSRFGNDLKISELGKGAWTKRPMAASGRSSRIIFGARRRWSTAQTNNEREGNSFVSESGLCWVRVREREERRTVVDEDEISGFVSVGDSLGKDLVGFDVGGEGRVVDGVLRSNVLPEQVVEKWPES